MNCYTYAKMLKRAADEVKKEQAAVDSGASKADAAMAALNENWNKLKNYIVQNRAWTLPTATGVGMTGLSYAGLGAVPAFQRDKVLRLLASGAIGAATAGGTYAVDRYLRNKPEKVS